MRRLLARRQFSLSWLLVFVTAVAVVATLWRWFGYHGFFFFGYAVVLFLFVCEAFRLHEPAKTWPSLTATEWFVVLSLFYLLLSFTRPSVQTGHSLRRSPSAARPLGK